MAGGGAAAADDAHERICCVDIALWISVETNTGEGLRSAVEGFEGGKSWLKWLCNQPEIRDQ